MTVQVTYRSTDGSKHSVTVDVAATDMDQATGDAVSDVLRRHRDCDDILGTEVVE